MNEDTYMKSRPCFLVSPITYSIAFGWVLQIFWKFSAKGNFWTPFVKKLITIKINLILQHLSSQSYLKAKTSYSLKHCYRHTSSIAGIMRYMKKLLSSDWLRQMQFSSKSAQKSVNSVKKNNKPDWTIPWTVKPGFELFCTLKMRKYHCILLFWLYVVVLTERTMSLPAF